MFDNRRMSGVVHFKSVYIFDMVEIMNSISIDVRVKIIVFYFYYTAVNESTSSSNEG